MRDLASLEGNMEPHQPRLLQTTLSLRIGLMVGVGGAMPSIVHEIRLGDVVISCPEGTLGGVLQYDMGKIGTGGEFSRTGSLNSPPRPLLTALNSMRAVENARTRKAFLRPGTNKDRLFKPEYTHLENTNECDACLTEWEEARSEREDTAPQAHYGVIASGNAHEQHHHEREKRALTKRQQKCHQSFKIRNYTEQKDINPMPAEGTCQWALQSTEYIRWLDGKQNDLLWVSADPGCGKSVLARSIIDSHIHTSSPRMTICYFFFKDNEAQNSLSTALVQSYINSLAKSLIFYIMPYHLGKRMDRRF
ncbi:hypothetical protein HAV15_008739 [Penicillium sp. str. |nr:hypothetical protein HAV15_008739 [Penicillium sp. str. \